MGGQTLLERAVARLGGVFQEILVVTSQKGLKQIEESSLEFGPKVSLITDLCPGKGSLGGIYSGLAMSPAFHNLVVACDMPFLNRHLLAYMVRQAPGSDVIIPRLGGIPEPLHAIYSRNCLGPMKALLDNDRLKIIDFFPQVRVRYIEEEEIAPLDPQRLSFFNVNTAADLQRAQELEASMGLGHHQAGGSGVSPDSPARPDATDSELNNPGRAMGLGHHQAGGPGVSPDSPARPDAMDSELKIPGRAEGLGHHQAGGSGVSPDSPVRSDAMDSESNNPGRAMDN